MLLQEQQLRKQRLDLPTAYAEVYSGTGRPKFQPPSSSNSSCKGDGIRQSITVSVQDQDEQDLEADEDAQKSVKINFNHGKSFD